MWQRLLWETRSSPDNLEDDKQEVGEEENLANTRVEAETLAGLRMRGSIQGREKHNDDGKKNASRGDDGLGGGFDGAGFVVDNGGDQPRETKTQTDIEDV